MIFNFFLRRYRETKFIAKYLTRWNRKNDAELEIEIILKLQKLQIKNHIHMIILVNDIKSYNTSPGTIIHWHSVFTSSIRRII